MSRPAPARGTSRQTWADGLRLDGQRDLRTSLVTELAEYLDQPIDQVAARCATARRELAQAWQAAAPTAPAAVTAFYRETDSYLFDLTWWHALVEDDSALVQVEALETALARGCRSALDFGSGIGSLGLLLARHGLAVTLADVNARLNAYAQWRFERRGLRARLLDLNVDRLPVGVFDFIAAIDVLEHLADPGAAAAALAAALRPGGTLVIHLPGEPDGQHPQHIALDANALLRRLSEAGLCLERAGGPTIVLRRGSGPRYSLNPALKLVSRVPDGLLLSTYPLLAMRLNPQAKAVLAHLDGGRTAAQLSAETGLASIELVSFLEDCVRRRLLMRQPPALVEWPMVSILVPARGRPAETRACVGSLLALDYPADRLEIVIIDDASDPPLGEALAGMPVRLIRQATNTGQSGARNRAATEAHGDLVAFIDNDCLAEPGWLRALVPHFDDPTVGIVGGRVVAPRVTGPIAAFEAVRSPLDMGSYGGEVGPAEAVPYLPTCNLIVRREVLRSVGGFDQAMALGEDVDFVWRTGQAGWRAWYAPEGRVIHHHRIQLWSLLGRRADYGSSEADLQRRHPAGRRVMVVPASVSALLAALAAGLVNRPAGVILVTLSVLSLTVEFGVKFRRLRRSGVCLPAGQVMSAVLREHVAALYHLAANVARYYSLPLLCAGLIWPALLLPLAVLLFVNPSLSYVRRRPQVSLPVFLGLYVLEMLAYQAGVWRGCLRHRTLRPLVPRLRLSW
jgi:mycofactocin system glycosyltransferase